MMLHLPAIAGRLAMLVSLAAPSVAFDTYPKNPGIDALNYAFRIELSDTTDAIVGEMTLDLRFLAPNVRSVRLDLAKRDAAHGGKGMQVSAVTMDGAAVSFTHANDELLIPLAAAPAVQQRSRVVVRYSGTPASGLAIKKNRYGDRTFFSDNWPDKARQWLPTIDHPYDKATSEFIVTAPSHYQVVSNGLPVEVTDLPGERRLTHWRNSIPIAPWLFTLGVARFAAQRVDTFEGKPIETWVYAQDRDAGFADFATPTRSVLAFFSDYVGPFAYEKLANVQSSTVSGGMEAASAIMYDEKSVTGTRSVRWRNVVIHEIAHQWFGNAVTEADWDDVWLSEGFATYFTQLYIEHAYGRDEFVRGMSSSRRDRRDVRRGASGLHDRPQKSEPHGGRDELAHVSEGELDAAHVARRDRRRGVPARYSVVLPAALQRERDDGGFAAGDGGGVRSGSRVVLRRVALQARDARR